MLLSINKPLFIHLTIKPLLVNHGSFLVCLLFGKKGTELDVYSVGQEIIRNLKLGK